MHTGSFCYILFDQPLDSSIYHDTIASEIFHCVSTDYDIFNTLPDNDTATVYAFYPVIFQQNIISRTALYGLSSHCLPNKNGGTIVADIITITTQLSPYIMDVAMAD